MVSLSNQGGSGDNRTTLGRDPFGSGIWLDVIYTGIIPPI